MACQVEYAYVLQKREKKQGSKYLLWL
jgi:hypothetical protein